MFFVYGLFNITIWRMLPFNLDLPSKSPVEADRRLWHGRVPFVAEVSQRTLLPLPSSISFGNDQNKMGVIIDERMNRKKFMFCQTKSPESPNLIP